MAERRPLVEGLKPRTETPRSIEEQFVFGEKARGDKPAAATPAPVSAPTTPPALTTYRSARPVSRVPFTTRLRADMAQALKRASLERQLEGIEPCTVQDILESALEPWLKANGYLE